MVFSGKETLQLCTRNKMKTSSSAEKIYLIMNKPCGYVCSAVSDSHKTVYDLLTPELRALVQGAKRGSRLHTIGRLDCDTSGLLLLTTDGFFSHRITANTVVEPVETTAAHNQSEVCGSFDKLNHRMNRISKTYRTTLINPVSPGAQSEYITRAAAGLTLPPEKKYGEQQSEPAALHFLTSDICEITVYEGKFHEVRRIFRALGNEVKELERISIGALTLPEDLTPGKWRNMTETEKNSVVE